MMYKKKSKGFSLAELLISLLIISIVLAAAIPTITKRNSAASEKIWHWAGKNSNIYFGMGANQGVIIGANQMPFNEDKNVEKFFTSDQISVDTSTMKFSTDGDRLVLIKASKPIETAGETENLISSHISFYNIENKTSATAKDITYAGRIATDEHNLAFGIGSLQQSNKVTNSFQGYNTALGHYSLFYNKSGQYNTAVGENTLTYTLTGSENTAVGYSALKNIEDIDKLDGKPKSGNSGNTAVGAYAASTVSQGDHNTAVGAGALIDTDFDEGIGNTSIGYHSCQNLKGDYNICIGHNAGVQGTSEASKDYALYIGSSEDDDNNVPLITGRTRQTPNASGTSNIYIPTYDKELVVNAFNFEVRPFDNSIPIFQVIAASGYPYKDDGSRNGQGYNRHDVEGNDAKFGFFRFNLRDTFGGDTSSLFANLSGYVHDEEKQARLIINNPYSGSQYGDLNVNDEIILKHSTTDVPYAQINAIEAYADTTQGANDEKILSINERFTIAPKSKVRMDLQNGYGLMILEHPDVDDPFASINESTVQSQISVYEGTLSAKLKNVIWIDAPEIKFSETSYITSDLNMSGNILMSTPSATNGVVISYDDVTIPTLTIGGGSVKSAIETLNSKIVNSGTTSDARLKNISGDSKAGLKEITALEVKNYTYKNDKEKTPHVGVIAQQLQKVFPNSVFKAEDGYLRIKTEEIFWGMVNSIKELVAQIQDLTAKITGLDKRITELEEQNKLLKKQNEEFEKRLAKLEKQASK